MWRSLLCFLCMANSEISLNFSFYICILYKYCTLALFWNYIIVFSYQLSSLGNHSSPSFILESSWIFILRFATLEIQWWEWIFIPFTPFIPSLPLVSLLIEVVFDKTEQRQKILLDQESVVPVEVHISYPYHLAIRLPCTWMLLPEGLFWQQNTFFL